MGRPRRGELSPRLAKYRQAANLTQQEVADRIGTTAEMVGRHERGIALPIKFYRLKYCELFAATEDQLGLRASTEAPDSRASSGPSVTAVQTTVRDSDNESTLDIFRRIHKFSGTPFNGEIVHALDSAIVDTVRTYEGAEKEFLARSLIKQRRWLDGLIDDCRHPTQRRSIYRLAGQTSGILGYIAVNRGEFSIARAYCSEAFHLGDFGESPELQAWARGTHSFCEYYAGDFISARDLARSGLKLSAGGAQSVRLAVNGEARALGKLGDVEGVHRAVEAAYRQLERHPVVQGVSSPVSFDGYCLSRTASNAVTAYVPLGLPDYVQEHADIAMPEFESSESRWSQSLLRLDLANSLINSGRPDLDRACSLVREALEISQDRPITSVLQRSREFLASTRRWTDSQSIVNIRHAVKAAEISANPRGIA
ncbi:helix-turn-helix domain-containing protein [Candidatus Frankia nodulisporulans]